MRLFSSTMVSFLSVLLVAGPGLSREPGKRLVVFPIGSSSIDAALTEQVRSQATLLAGFDFVTADDTVALLNGASELDIRCKEKEFTCYAQIAALGGADVAIVPNRKDRELSLTIVDIATASPRASVTRTLIDGKEILVIQDALVELLTPEKFVATLAIIGGNRGATVLVDNEAMGVLPLDAPLSVKAGARTVAIVDGDIRHEESLTLTVGQQATVTVPGTVTASSGVVDASDDAASTEDGLFVPLLGTGGAMAGFGALLAATFVVGSAAGWQLGCTTLTGPARSEAFCTGDNPTPASSENYTLYLAMNAGFGAAAVAAGLVALAGIGVAGAAFVVE